MSKDLLPVSTLRAVYNGVQPPERQLPHYSDSLTAPEAQFINDHYAIEVYGIFHGKTSLDVAERANLAADGLLPAASDYAAIKLIVDSMVPGQDTLFVENFGHQGLTAYDWSEFEKDSIDPQNDPYVRAWKRSFVDILAKQGEIGTLQYAAMLAEIDNIEVFNADMDTFDLGRMREAGAYPSKVSFSEDPVQDTRRGIAVGTMKHRALHSAGARHIESGHDKPRLVLLFGHLHRERFTHKLHTMGLDGKVMLFVQSTRAERIEEGLAKVAIARPNTSV